MKTQRNTKGIQAALQAWSVLLSMKIGMPKHLFAILIIGILCHVVLLDFELPVITSAVKSFLTHEPLATSGMAGILIVHALINTGLGALYAALAKPPMREALIYGGIAAGLPNAVCTLAGAMLVITSMASQIKAVLGFDLLEPAMMFGVILFALSTGLLAAPLGMGGAVIVRRFVQGSTR